MALPRAQGAVGKAIELAKAFGSDVSIVYVIDPYPFTGLGSDFAYGQAEYLSAAAAEAKQANATALQACQLAGVSAKANVVEAHWSLAGHPGGCRSGQRRPDCHGLAWTPRPGKTGAGQRNPAGAITQQIVGAGGQGIKETAS